MIIVNLGNEADLVIATIALVIATIALVIVTAHYNKKLWIAQDRPWLYIKKDNFESRHWLNFKNVGKGIALNVEYTILNGESNETHLLPMIPVNEEIGITNSEWSHLKETMIKDIAYDDINGKHYEQDDIEIK